MAYISSEEKKLDKKLMALSRMYVNKSDKLYSRMMKVKPYKDYEDFGVHGVPDEAKVMYETDNGIETMYDGAEFAEILMNDPSYKGGKIRLLSCGAGAGANSFASELSKAIKKEVIAPTETLWIGEAGQLFISNSDSLAEMWYNDGKINNQIRQSGEWKRFLP